MPIKESATTYIHTLQKKKRESAKTEHYFPSSN